MQKKYKTILTNISIIILFILPLFLSSCSMTSSTKTQSRSFFKGANRVKVYFLKSTKPDELSFVSLSRRISPEDSPIDASLYELFLGPTKNEQLDGIMSEIPEGTRLLKVESSKDEIIVDVSSQFLIGGGSANAQLKYLQLYKTLKDVAPEKKIYLNIDGKPLKAIGGEGLEISQPIMVINDYTKKYDKTDKLQP